MTCLSIHACYCADFEVNTHMLISRCVSTDSLSALQNAASDRISGCVLKSPTVISSCDPDYFALHRPVVRDTAGPTVQAFAATMQHCASGTQRQPCADATKGNREHQTHL